jgi:predicted nucleic acid-binding protein
LILLDTNVLSELVKPRPDARVVAWTRHSAAALAIPTIAVAEMAFGIEKLVEGKRREDLMAGLHRLVTEFAERLFDFDVKAAWAYRRILATARAVWPDSGLMHRLSFWPSRDGIGARRRMQ